MKYHCIHGHSAKECAKGCHWDIDAVSESEFAEAIFRALMRFLAAAMVVFAILSVVVDPSSWVGGSIIVAFGAAIYFFVGDFT